MGNPLGKMLSNPLDKILTDFSKMDFRNSINAGGELFFVAFQKYIKEREAALGKGESLMVIHHQTGRPIAVHTIGYIGSQVFLLVGRDGDNNDVHVVASVSSVQLEIRVTKDEGEEQPKRIGFYPLPPSEADTAR